MIHQIQIKYDAMADRLCMQVRTRQGEVYALWMTRRMVQRLWPALQQVATRQALGKVQPHAVVLPEAQAMLAEAVRQKPLPHSDFSQPFSAEPAQRPLGEEPMLATEVELQAQPGSGMRIKLVDDRRRQLTLQLTDELHAALLRLLEQAVAAADWGLAPPAPAAAAPPGPPALLN